MTIEERVKRIEIILGIAEPPKAERGMNEALAAALNGNTKPLNLMFHSPQKYHIRKNLSRGFSKKYRKNPQNQIKEDNL